MKSSITLCVVSFLAATSISAGEPVDLDMVNKIRDEGFNRSEVMESLRVLTDEVGPRLTASPGMRAASKWTVEQLRAWGVEEVYLESFEFGRGWASTRTEIFMTEPRLKQLHGLPLEWHPGTDGVREAEILFAPIKSLEDFEKWTGKLEGKMVLLDEPSPPVERFGKTSARLNEEELDERLEFKVPVGESSHGERWAKRLDLRRKIFDFLSKEGALAVILNNGRAGLAIDTSAYLYHAGLTPEIPAVVLATEHYERLLRLAENEHIVRLSVDVEASYFDDDHNGYSTIAEIPGKGRDPEIVMAGAHIDSHSTGDGASDNAAGVAVVMEALRILKTLDVQPTRSIRIGLWSGEEQEYYGSGRHVRTNFGYFPRRTEDEYKFVGDYEAADLTKPFVKEGDYERFSVYFNVDNGPGRIRGIHTQGNAAVRPIFESWFEPFHDLGATHVTPDDPSVDLAHLGQRGRVGPQAVVTQFDRR